jgi:hypothetical protein
LNSIDFPTRQLEISRDGTHRNITVHFSPEEQPVDNPTRAIVIYGAILSASPRARSCLRWRIMCKILHESEKKTLMIIAITLALCI